ncbi:hypothetical protein EB230_20875 [Mesorhizobium sp. NZP2234]|uniref:hypothetical protein n=1 Tax=Mesorhizobium sp. NZP2234 TaxID=2483402 RepID=UPI0015524FCC|nr:hypothetical protein [Mesorhizobium sp. NZP2234]QKC90583.1 hypothetical protein EB230_20875 [Mesorhizobium sp. NZP2234]
MLKRLVERGFAICGSLAAIVISLALLHGLHDAWQPVLFQFVVLKWVSFAMFMFIAIFSLITIIEATFGTKWFGPLR